MNFENEIQKEAIVREWAWSALQE